MCLNLYCISKLLKIKNKKIHCSKTRAAVHNIRINNK